MPKNHNWFRDIQLGNPDRRERDNQRKRKIRGANNEDIPPRLASYQRIDNAIYETIHIGGHKAQYYRLRDLGDIYGLSRSTVRRWYREGLLPEAASRKLKGQSSGGVYYVDSYYYNSEPLYLKQQVLVICTVLNSIYAQGVTQFRRSHIHHIDMMYEGCRIALERFQIKLATQPKKPIRILPPPSEWAKLRAQGKQHLLTTASH